ncbi:MAG TPA: hypothetical protein VG267_19850 [Terracidiphilus sp.]|nr:hypothetical protein [Terracidiphilus sp.]
MQITPEGNPMRILKAMSCLAVAGILSISVSAQTIQIYAVFAIE